MRNIKCYKLFESKSPLDLHDTIFDLSFILLPLKDDGWSIDLHYSPKRWGSNKSIIEYDVITVDIRKKGIIDTIISKFRMGEISEIVRIFDMYETSRISVMIDTGKSHYTNNILRWDDIDKDLDKDIHGLRIEIPLFGENLDHFDNSKIDDY